MLTIEDMGSDGEGIGKVDGFTLFIKDAVIGDQVEAKIIKSKKHYAYARLEKVLQPSPFRVEPKCAYHRQCGGCQLQAISYSEQLHFKEQKIRNNLIRIGGFDAEYIDERMQPIVGMEEPFHYRNKAQYPIGTDRDGNVSPVSMPDAPIPSLPIQTAPLVLLKISRSSKPYSPICGKIK